MKIFHQFPQIMGKYYFCSFLSFLVSVMLLVSGNLVNIPYVFAETSYSSSGGGYREIRVIQGYPRSNHQGYNWSSTIAPTLSVKSAHKVVNNKKNKKNAQVTPNILLKRSSSSIQVHGTTISPADTFNPKWKPVIGLNRTFSKISKQKSVLPSSQSPLVKKSGKDLLNLSGLSNFTANVDKTNGDGDKSRKINVVVPFHPRFASIARLLARSCKMKVMHVHVRIFWRLLKQI